MTTGYHFRDELWLWTGEAAWHFVTLPDDVSDDIEARTSDTRRGFGSVRVGVTVGATTWSTSVFPDTTREADILPVKKDIRRREELEIGDQVDVSLQIADA